MNSIQKADNILLKGGKVLDLTTGKQTVLDIVLKDGKIDKMGKVDENFNGRTYDVSNHIIVQGLMDMHVHLREPGREDEETIKTGCASAMAGGFTSVCAMPNTEPPCDSQEVVRFLKKKSERELVDVYPIAAVTKKRLGAEITEMADLIKAGAVAFSDDGSPVEKSAVMRHALEYSSMYNAPIIDHCEDPSLFKGGHMNESEMSTRLGIPGIPNIAEDIMISRNIELAKFTGGRIHIAHLSTKGGVEMIKRAKDQGINITCEVTPHHLVLTDKDLVNYDTNLKMNPPLRTQQDVDALLKGLKDGTIDVIASDHAPHSIEEKDVEFNAAPFGIIGLETMLGIIITKVVNKGLVPLKDILTKFAITPREILRMPIPQISVGETANLTIFHPTKEWIVDKNKLKSLSKNTPFHGWALQGAVFGVVNKGIISTIK